MELWRYLKDNFWNGKLRENKRSWIEFWVSDLGLKSFYAGTLKMGQDLRQFLPRVSPPETGFAYPIIGSG